MATKADKGTVSSTRIDHKQTRALHERHQAQVGTNESLAGADTETASGAEQTTAESPDTRKERLRGRSNDRVRRSHSTMEDEVPVTGKDYSKSRYAEGGKVRGDKSQTRSSSGKKSAPRLAGKAKAEAHKGGDQTVSVDDLPVGSRIEIFQHEVRISAPIAGGAIRTFHGPRRDPALDADGQPRARGANEQPQGFEAALEDMNKFARGEGQSLETASPEEKRAKARANEAGARGLTEGATFRPRAGRATKTHSGAKGDSGARKSSAKKSAAKRSGAKRKR